MFEYFPKNYPWNLAVNSAINAGGVIVDIGLSDIHRAAQRVLHPGREHRVHAQIESDRSEDGDQDGGHDGDGGKPGD